MITVAAARAAASAFAVRRLANGLFLVPRGLRSRGTATNGSLRFTNSVTASAWTVDWNETDATGAAGVLPQPVQRVQRQRGSRCERGGGAATATGFLLARRVWGLGSVPATMAAPPRWSGGLDGVELSTRDSTEAAGAECTRLRVAHCSTGPTSPSSQSGATRQAEYSAKAESNCRSIRRGHGLLSYPRRMGSDFQPTAPRNDDRWVLSYCSVSLPLFCRGFPSVHSIYDHLRLERFRAHVVIPSVCGAGVIDRSNAPVAGHGNGASFGRLFTYAATSVPSRLGMSAVGEQIIGDRCSPVDGHLPVHRPSWTHSSSANVSSMTLLDSSRCRRQGGACESSGEDRRVFIGRIRPHP